MKFQFRYLTANEAVLATVTTTGETFDLCKRQADATAQATMRRPDYALCRARCIEPERVAG
jgi:hypothetical protein